MGVVEVQKGKYISSGLFIRAENGFGVSLPRELEPPDCVSRAVAFQAVVGNLRRFPVARMENVESGLSSALHVSREIPGSYASHSQY